MSAAEMHVCRCVCHVLAPRCISFEIGADDAADPGAARDKGTSRMRAKLKAFGIVAGLAVATLREVSQIGTHLSMMNMRLLQLPGLRAMAWILWGH